ncbi:MAG: hypothetical protein OCD01_15795 [Fibrobacterales bacterium]
MINVIKHFRNRILVVFSFYCFVLSVNAYGQLNSSIKYNDSFVTKPWVMIFESYQYGLFYFTWDEGQQDYFISTDIQSELYKSGIDKHLPVLSRNKRLYMKDLYDSKFFILFHERKGYCFVLHSDYLVGATIRETLKKQTYSKVWNDVANDYGSIDKTKFEYGIYPKYEKKKKEVLPYDESFSLAVTPIDTITIVKLMNEVDSIKSRLNIVEDELHYKNKLLDSLDTGNGYFLSSKHGEMKEVVAIKTERVQDVVDIQNVEEEETADISVDEMYRLAFGIESPDTPDKFQCELVINGKKQGTVWFYNKENKLDSRDLLAVLKNQFIQDSLNLLKKIVVDDKISIHDLNKKKIMVQAQFEGGICYMQFPFEWFKEEFHARGLVEDSARVEPHVFSGYLNVRGRQKFKDFDYKMQCDVECQENLIIPESQRFPLNFNFDGAVNLFSVVSEINATYYQEDSIPFHITSARIVKDIRDYRTRLMLGDLNLSGGGGGGGLFGVGAVKVRRITSTRNARKLNDVEFELKNASEVKVYVNDKLTKIQTFSPGIYSITETELGDIKEESEVVLEILDFAGNRDKLDFTFLQFDSEMLVGESMWDASLGYRRQQELMDISPELDSLVLQGGYSKKLNKWIRGGSRAMVSMYGEHTVSSTAFFDLDLMIMSLAVGEQYSKEVLGLYTELGLSGNVAKKRQSEEGALAWRLRARYRDNYLGDRQSRKSVKDNVFLQFSAGVNVSLPNKTVMGLQGGYYVMMDSIGKLDSKLNETLLSATISKSFENNLQTGISFNYRKDFIDGSDLSVGVEARYSFRAGKHAFRVSDRLNQRKKTREPELNQRGEIIENNYAPVKEWVNSGQLSWSHNNYGKSGFAYGSGAAATLADEYIDVGTDVNGSSNWGDMRVGYRFVDQNSEYVNVIQRETSLDFATGIAWAGTSVGITRPVYGSFAIVRNNKNMTFKTTRVNPLGENDEEGVVYPFIPMVLTNFGNYQTRELMLEPDLPFGSEEINTSYSMESGYKSGFEFKVGSVDGVVLLGTLMQESGLPFSRRVFRMYELNDDGEIIREKVQASFTNQDGRFQATCLVGRKYKIEIKVDSYIYGGYFKIPEGAEALFDAGDFIVAQVGDASQKKYQKAFEELLDKQKTNDKN